MTDAERIADLERRVAYMERVIAIMPSPGFGTRLPGQPPMFTHNPWSNCTKCGIDLHKVMCYTCPDPSCPTGLGPVTC